MRMRRSALVSVTVLVLAAPVMSAATAGGAPVKAANAKVAAHSDFDGDGKPDIAVGSMYGNRVLIDYTGAKPKGSHRQWIASPQAQQTYDFGAALATGDFNGDGFADLAIAAPQYTTTVGDTEGAVYLYSGSKTGLHYSGRAFYGPAVTGVTESFGSSLGAGTPHGAKFSELAIGNPGDSATVDNEGSVTVIAGSKAGLKKTAGHFWTISSPEPVANGAFGTSVALGDLNGDGHEDLVVGEPGGGPVLSGTLTASGELFAYPGRTAGLAAKPTTFSGATLGAAGALGTSLATGDVNGDGYADVAAGAPYATVSGQGRAGKVLVLLGSKHGLAAKGAKALSKATGHVAGNAVSTDRFGFAVAVGDLTHDGRGELVVGVPGGTAGAKASAGEVYVFRGTKSGVTALGSQLITQATKGVPGNPVSGASFGTAVTTLGMASAVHRELIVGVPFTGAGGSAIVAKGGPHGVTGTGAKALTDPRDSDGLGAALPG